MKTVSQIGQKLRNSNLSQAHLREAVEAIAPRAIRKRVEHRSSYGTRVIFVRGQKLI